MGVTILKFSSRKLTQARDWDAPKDSAANQTLEDPRSVFSGTPQAPTSVGTQPASRARERVNQIRNPKSPENQASSDLPPSQNRSTDLYSYEARIRNVGEGTIVAVAWEYWFLEPGTGTPLDRHRFQTFRRAESGKSITLSGKSPGPRVISAAARGTKPRLFEESVVIKCIAYSDGTFRRLAASSASDCDDIRNGQQAQRK